jgi:hypothetical protein
MLFLLLGGFGLWNQVFSVVWQNLRFLSFVLGAVPFCARFFFALPHSLYALQSQAQKHKNRTGGHHWPLI